MKQSDWSDTSNSSYSPGFPSHHAFLVNVYCIFVNYELKALSFKGHIIA